MKRFLFLCLVFSSIINIYAQIWVSFNESGMDYRNMVFANSLLKAFGDDSISVWLKANTHLHIVVDTDSLGYLVQIRKLQKINKESRIDLSFVDCQKVYEAWREINLRIPFCYEPIHVRNQRELIIKEIRSNQTNIYWHSIVFPPLNCYKCSLDSLKSKIEKILDTDNPTCRDCERKTFK